MAGRGRAGRLSDSGIHQSSSPEDTAKLADWLAQKLVPGDIVAFFGDLGSGKTTFIRSLAASCAQVAPESVCSPTFQYLNVYTGPLPIYHFDLYRLTGPDDFFQMGFEEILHGQGVSCIEWAERIEDSLPEGTIRIYMKHVEENRRQIEIL